MTLDDLELAEQMATLGSFIAPLKQAGFDCQLVEANDELDLPTLVVGLPVDDDGRGRWLTVNIVPLEAADTVGLTIAQVYSPLPFALDDGHRDEFGRFAIAANMMLPIGSMGAREDGEVYFRYMLTSPGDTPPSPDMLPRLASLFEFQLDVFGEAMEAVATGESTADEALASLGEY